MIRKSFFAAFTVAAAALVGCNEKNVLMPEDRPGDVHGSDDGMVHLTVALDSPVTRFTGSTEGKTFRSIQTYVFDEDDVLEAYSYVEGDKPGVISCTKGSKTVAVLVNAAAHSDVSDLASLRLLSSDLFENEPDACVMEGTATADVTGDVTVPVEVTRQVAKISLESVKVDFALDHYKDETLAVKAIYMVNVAGNRFYLADTAPTVWYNRMKAENTSSGLIYDTCTENLKDGESLSSAHYFYVCPNPHTEDVESETWSVRPTRLVVEAQIGTDTYYYPVTIPGVVSNTEYAVNLTISRPGSSSPDVPVDKYSLSVDITVKDWVQGKEYVETI